MNTIRQKALQALLPLIVLFFAALAIARTYNGTHGAFLAKGAWDFLSYWSQGHLVRLGSQFAYGPRDPLVSLTPPLIFVLSLFSYFPWPVAKLIWISILVPLVVATPWLVLYLLPVKPSFRLQILVALMFYGLTGTSIAIRAGQPTILVLFLMLLTLVFVKRGRKILPGLILGLALSKLNLSLPIVLFLLYKRNWSVVITGIGVQIVGFLALAQLTQVPVLSMISNYRGFLKTHTGTSFINLIHIAGHFPHTSDQFIAIGLAVTILLFGVVWWAVLRYKVKSPTPEVWDYTLLAVLNLWGLLAGFHHQYDIGPSIFAIALLISAISNPNLWGLSPLQLKGFTAVAVVGLVGIIVLPPGLSYIPQVLTFWAPIRWRMMTVGIAVLLSATIWLWRQGSIRFERDSRLPT